MNVYYDWLLAFLAIFVPPVSVLIKYPPTFLQKLFRSKNTKKYHIKQTNNEFYLSVFLFFIGYIPSLIHALYLISKNDEHYRSYNELKRRYKHDQNRKKKHLNKKTFSKHKHASKLSNNDSQSYLLPKSVNTNGNKMSTKDPLTRVRIQESNYGSVV